MTERGPAPRLLLGRMPPVGRRDAGEHGARMCQSKTYLIARGVESEVMDDVVKITRDGTAVVLTNMKGETRRLDNAYVGEVDTLMDKIVLYEREPTPQAKQRG